jgi:hypothetical protein
MPALLCFVADSLIFATHLLSFVVGAVFAFGLTAKLSPKA